MTDKEAISSTIQAYLDLCLNLYDEKDKDGLPITACFCCQYKKERDCYCFVDKITDKLIEIIPQLDLYKKRKK